MESWGQQYNKEHPHGVLGNMAQIEYAKAPEKANALRITLALIADYSKTRVRSGRPNS